MAETIEVLRGADYSLTCVLNDSAGDPVDITGYNISFTVKCKASTNTEDGEALISKDSLTITDAANGQFTLTLTNDDTKIPYGDYIFGFKVKTDSGDYIPSYSGVYKCAKVATNRET